MFSQFKNLPTLDVLKRIFPIVKRIELECICVNLWSIWWNRNLIVQKNEPKNAADLVIWALEFLSEFQGTHQALSATITQPEVPHKLGWCPPPIYTLKLNSDVSIRDGFHFIGLVAAIRNHKGEIVAAISKPLQGSFCAELGEFLAHREGLLLAKRLNLTLKLAEVDDVDVVNAVTEEMGIFSLITGMPGSSGFGSSSTAEDVTHGIDATNLTVLITGGASGIGLETARVLALRGAHVIIAARNMKAASEAKKLIVEENETARVDVLKLDLASIASVRSFVDKFNSLDLPLNILINNAGIMFCPYQLSDDGIEIQFATNHLGHFLLTNLLLEKMKKTAKDTGIEGRIVNLSSIAHQYTYKGGIRFDKINKQSSYSDKKAYGQSKLANILHANELSRRFQEEGVNITANSVHPGLIMTNLMKHSALLMRFLKVFSFFIWKNVPQGAATTCYVALHPKLKGVTGKYFIDCNEMPPSSVAKDQTLARNLWEFSNKLVRSASNKA
ncbi:hypothetical protein QYF36_005453 [Acer negundo]|nr:hypothetical protein QYF36_005453 [Acer negundo]